jgi:hypothetical protein
VAVPADGQLPAEAPELCEGVGKAGQVAVPADGQLPAEAPELCEGVGKAGQVAAPADERSSELPNRALFFRFLVPSDAAG